MPTFLVVRMGGYLVHPAHRRQVLAGVCPNVQFLSLDWFSVGILVTGLPLAIQNLGPWLATNAVFLVGLFVLPRLLSARLTTGVKVATLLVGIGLFLYANYGSALAVLPDPSMTLGPVATMRLSDATTESMMQVVNSILVGPPLVAVFGVSMNRVLTRPELRDVPMLDHTLPRRDPDRIVVASAAFGTVFYLLVVALATGQLTLVP